MLKYILVTAIIIYPLLMLLIYRRKADRHVDSHDPKDYISEPARPVKYQISDDGVSFLFGKTVLPVTINGSKYNELKYDCDERELTVDNSRIICIDEKLIGNDFRDLGGIKTKGSYLRFNRIYRIANVSRLDAQQSAELKKTDFKYIFNLNKNAKAENRDLDLNKNNLVNIRILNGVSNTILFYKENSSDFNSWYAKHIYDEILNDLKLTGRLVKKIMQCDGPVIIQDGDGHFQNAVITVLLLMMLNVSSDDIANEYSLSNRHLSTLKNTNSNPAMIANPIVIRKLIANIDGEYDRREDFFRLFDIDEKNISDFRDKMTVDKD